MLWKQQQVLLQEQGLCRRLIRYRSSVKPVHAEPVGVRETGIFDLARSLQVTGAPPEWRTHSIRRDERTRATAWGSAQTRTA